MATETLPRDRPARRPLRSGDSNQRDPFDEIDGLAPNMGQDVLPHVVTFQGILRNVARTYYVSDEAMQHSWANARFMRNDPGIMECLEQRQRSTALLGWHLEAEDEKDPTQKRLIEEMTGLVRLIPNFLKYRENLLYALWYGKYGVQHRYRWRSVNGRMRVVLQRWKPVNGDKIVFRYDDGTGEYDDDQVGIRVGAGYTAGSQLQGRWKIERFGKVVPTDHGLAYFLEPWERPLVAIHKHMIEDAEYEDPARAGAIHGVGIRSRLYWFWYQKQEALAWMVEYLERSAFGMEIWSYPAGNAQAKAATMKAAQERIGNGRNIVLVPRHPDSDILSTDVKRVEPGMAGVDALDRIIREYFGWQIKRYILGQILTSETASTGLGSGVASIHLDTYLQIIRYDATNLGETLTTDLVKPLLRYNWPEYADMPIRFVIETESPDIEGKLGAWQRAYDMGLKLRSRDVAELIGAAVAQPDEETLQSPQHRQAAMEAQAGSRQPVASPNGNGDTSQLAAAFRGMMQKRYGRLRPGMERLIYDRRGNVRCIERYGKFTVGETRVVRGRTYRFNENSRWERVFRETDSPSSIHVAGNEFGVDWRQPKAWKAVFNAAMDLFQGRSYVNEQTDRTITVSRKGVNKVIHHLPDEKPLKALAKLPEMLRQADYIGEAAPQQEEANVRAFHYLGVDLMLENQPHYAIITVREDNNGDWFYDQRVDVLKKEGSSHGQVGTQTGQTGPAGEPSKGIIDPEEGEVKRNSREDYRATSPKHKAGWKTIGGGGRVFLDDDGNVKAGCPGLKGEDLDDLGEDEEPRNRRRREHRQDVAEHHGLEGDDLGHDQVQQLEDQPHPETGKDAAGRQKASPTIQRVKLAGREYEVKHDGGTWFYRLNEAAGWTAATEGTAAMIEGQVEPPAEQGQVQPEEASPGVSEIDTEKLQPSAVVKVHRIEPREDTGGPFSQASPGGWQQTVDLPDLASSAERAYLESMGFTSWGGGKRWLGKVRYDEETSRGESTRPKPETVRAAWQITKKAFLDSDPRLQQAQKRWAEARGEVGGRDRWGDTTRFEGKHAANRLARADAAQKAWSRAFAAAERKHEKAVRMAVKAAQDVPADVLRDYPNLEVSTKAPSEQAKANINARTNIGKAILQTAQDWELAPDDLADALDYVWEQRVTGVAKERQRALEAARKRTGLFPSDVKKLKNAGYDYSSAKKVGGRLGDRLARFDEFAQEMAREYPVLNLGDPDDPAADFGGALWEILDEDRARAIPMDHPDLLRQAAEMVIASKKYDPAAVLASTYEEFRRRGEVEKYRKWLSERYAKKSAGGYAIA